jgi:methenyltetrahydromethanopterin cyclohydrolase
MESLNEPANRVADEMEFTADRLRVIRSTVAEARVIDCGISAPGGLAAGLALARACLADLADVSLAPPASADVPFPLIQVATDAPLQACLASQYAGWQIAVGKYFALGSGPMRALYAQEPLFADLPVSKESAALAVGILETRKLPTEEVVQYLADKLQLPPERLTLLVAPTASVAGTTQVVARALETALHKLHELKFDLTTVESGYATAPLLPVAADDLAAIGRTNDAILYGGRVVLYVRATDEQIATIGPQVPASASASYGTPFAEIFRQAKGDFYAIDKLLFAPAEVIFCNRATGRCFSFGQPGLAVLRRSVGW